MDEMVGKIFYKLKVIKFNHSDGNNLYFECQCECGSSRICKGSYLRRKKIKSCKQCKYALHRKKGHGKKGTSIWVIWMGIKARCLNPNNRAYKNYGGRGIKICNRWLEFTNFYKDMGDRPEGLQIDRINNDGPYSKKNCRWVTPKENSNNRRNSRESNNKDTSKQICSETLSITNIGCD